MRVAYADPPYPGQADRHYGDHPDYAGEVDHTELIRELEASYPDGWALSTSAAALPDVLALCPRPEASRKRTWGKRGGIKLGTGVRVCIWYRKGGAPFPPSRIVWTWEPLIVRVPHWRQRWDGDFVQDVLCCSPSRGFVNGGSEIVGQKPREFCEWMFHLLGLRPGDELVDLFPGSGAVTAAWESWRCQPNLLGAA